MENTVQYHGYQGSEYAQSDTSTGYVFVNSFSDEIRAATSDGVGRSLLDTSFVCGPGEVYETSNDLNVGSGVALVERMSLAAETAAAGDAACTITDVPQQDDHRSVVCIPPPQARFPIIYVSPAGLLTIILRKDMAIETTLDKTIRLLNHNTKCVAATNQRGSSSCIFHSAAKILQNSTSTDADIYWGRKIKMITDNIFFQKTDTLCQRMTPRGMIPIYPGEELFPDMSKDMTVSILYGASGYGPDMITKLCEAAKNAQYTYHKRGGLTILINGMRIFQNSRGDVMVACGPKYIRASPNTGSLYIQTHFAELAVEASGRVRIKRGEQLIVADHTGDLRVSDGIYEAGYDCFNQVFYNPLLKTTETIIDQSLTSPRLKNAIQNSQAETQELKYEPFELQHTTVETYMPSQQDLTIPTHQYNMQWPQIESVTVTNQCHMQLQEQSFVYDRDSSYSQYQQNEIYEQTPSTLDQSTLNFVEHHFGEEQSVHYEELQQDQSVECEEHDIDKEQDQSEKCQTAIYYIEKAEGIEHTVDEVSPEKACYYIDQAMSHEDQEICENSECEGSEFENNSDDVAGQHTGSCPTKYIPELPLAAISGGVDVCASQSDSSILPFLDSEAKSEIQCNSAR